MFYEDILDIYKSLWIKASDKCININVYTCWAQLTGCVLSSFICFVADSSVTITKYCY